MQHTGEAVPEPTGGTGDHGGAASQSEVVERVTQRRSHVAILLHSLQFQEFRPKK